MMSYDEALEMRKFHIKLFEGIVNHLELPWSHGYREEVIHPPKTNGWKLKIPHLEKEKHLETINSWGSGFHVGFFSGVYIIFSFGSDAYTLLRVLNGSR